MKKNNQSGFTLIEIIVTLVLLGILGAVAGMGIVQATNAYLFTRNASAMSQKAQAAYARLGRTFLNISEVDFTGGSPGSRLQVIIERNNTRVTETYRFTGTTMTLETGGATHLLLDDLANTSGFSYLKNDGSAWTTADDESDLSRIQVNIALNSPGGQAIPFSATFVPRNVYRPVELSDFSSGQTGLPNTSGCFISTLVSEKTIPASRIYIMAGGLLMILFIPVAGKMKFKKLNQRGSILVGVIITIIVMGVLAAAMTSMFSTSSVGTVTPNMSNSAYYTAESAYRLALYTFLNANEDVRFQTLKNTLHGKTVVVEGNNRADIEIDAFFFTVRANQTNTTALVVDTPVSFPDEYVDSSGVRLPSTGLLAVEGDNNNPIAYTAVTYNSGNNTLRFTLAAAKTFTAGTAIFPAFRNSAMTSLISEGSNISLGTGANQGNLGGFPLKNGVFSLTTTAGGVYVLLYERLDLTSNPARLINVTSAANMGALPSGGLQNYGSVDHISLLQNTRISVTGHAGNTSTSFNAERRIDYYQPMLEGTIITKHEYTDNFDNLDNWRTGTDGQLGSHAIVQVDDTGVENADGDNAVSVTQTAVRTSAITFNYSNRNIQESLLEYDPDVVGFEDLWRRSEEKLSYEIQCKVSFSYQNDNADNNPKGTYMPGIIFRARQSTVSGTRVKEYYGLSFVRALFDRNNLTPSGSTDPDDVPDVLFEDHGTNDAIPSSVADDVCTANYTAPPTWNDLPPLSGVPYMMLWQQAFDMDEFDNGVWTRDRSSLKLDWMSYVPLCQLTPVTIYYYPAQTILGADSVPCAPCAACTPKTWRKYYWDSPIGFPGTTPACCIAVTQTGSGGSIFNRWRDYRCDTYDCTGSCYNLGCCGAPVTYPEGWYLGPLTSDPRTPVTYTAYRIRNHQEYGEILQPVIKNVDGAEYSILGDMNNLVYIIRDPATFNVATGFRGHPIEDSAFVFPDQTVAFQNAHNYRVYLKPWVTVMARIIEMKGDFYDEDGSGCGNSDEERVNVIQAWFGEPGTYPRGTITWPDASPTSFSEMIWPDRGYSSRMDDITVGWSTESKRLVERGDDEYAGNDDKRSPLVYSNQLTTEDYDVYTTGNQPSEVGIHTFGIDASNASDEHKDLVYFDDFSVRVFEYGKSTGLLPGVQNE